MSTKPKTWDGKQTGKRGSKKKDPVVPAPVEPIPDEADLETQPASGEASG